jgi:hypothetical protein
VSEKGIEGLMDINIQYYPMPGSGMTRVSGQDQDPTRTFYASKIESMDHFNRLGGLAIYFQVETSRR